MKSWSPLWRRRLLRRRWSEVLWRRWNEVSSKFTEVGRGSDMISSLALKKCKARVTDWAKVMMMTMTMKKTVMTTGFINN